MPNIDDPQLEENLAALDDPQAGLLSGAFFLALLRFLKALSARAVRLTVVDTVADLPAEAGPREWFRIQTGTLAERASLYVGNGQGRPLTKVTPTQL